MKKIVYTRPDGRLVVVHPVIGARYVHRYCPPGSNDPVFCVLPTPFDRLAHAFKVFDPDALEIQWAETEEEFLERVRSRSVPADATEVRIVDETAIPKDRSNRDHWKLEGDRIKA